MTEAELKAALDAITALIRKRDGNYVELERRVTALTEGMQQRAVQHDIELKRLPLVAGAMGARRDVSSMDHKGFSSFGDFVSTISQVPHGVSDDRLGELLSTKALSAGTGSASGYLIPEAFSAALMDRILTERAQIRPRALVLPRDADAPDAPIDLPTLDISGTKGRMSGIEMEWIKEAESKPETEPSIANVRFEPEELAGFLVVSDKLLRNAPLLEQWLLRVFSEAIAYMTESAYFQGSGAGQPRGILGHPATIVVPRNAAGEVQFEDVVLMESVAALSPNSIWLASSSIKTELLTMTLTDTAGEEPIWIPDRQGIGAMPLTLLGHPIFFPDYMPLLGVEGDLALCDFNWYGIRDGGPDAAPRLEANKGHASLFRTNQTALRIVIATDGQPLISTVIRRPDGEDYSPFVVLGDTGAGS